MLLLQHSVFWARKQAQLFICIIFTWTLKIKSSPQSEKSSLYFCDQQLFPWRACEPRIVKNVPMQLPQHHPSWKPGLCQRPGHRGAGGAEPACPAPAAAAAAALGRAGAAPWWRRGEGGAGLGRVPPGGQRAPLRGAGAGAAAPGGRCREPRVGRCGERVVRVCGRRGALPTPA